MGAWSIQIRWAADWLVTSACQSATPKDIAAEGMVPPAAATAWSGETISAETQLRNAEDW
jgi:hypothetical protein